MDKEYIDFIGVYKDVIPKEECERFIKTIDNYLSNSNPNTVLHGAMQFPTNELGRLDYAIHGMVELPDESKVINNYLQQCIAHYANEYFIVRQLPIESRDVKFQKTPPRGGYHNWHCEQGDIQTSDRVLAWMVYLNDIPENEGETEFIWQKLRVNPEAGKFLIWPAQYTHTHRGNPVYSCDKYIVTGWFTFTRKHP